ncbi:MAG: hypothetical protein ABI534_06555 [Chloroflexota bacterium]
MVPDALTGGPHFGAYCERYIRHTKGRWAGRPLIFDRVQAIRAERRTRHPGMAMLRRPYPLVRLMRCVHCESTFHGDAGIPASIFGIVAA